jgi:hypothetical protein
MKGFSIDGIIKTALERGIKNLLPVFVNTVLWIITIWIPYLNVGTTIGMTAGVVAKMSRGETIAMTEIFNPQYRKRMGEFFLVVGFMFLGIFAGFIFFIIPGYVISLSWSLAPLLVVDKMMNPIDAIHKSNSLTYGKKWTIFFGLLTVGLCGVIALGIVFWIFALLLNKIGIVGSILLALLYITGYAVFISIQMAAMSYIYGKLAK